MYGNQKLQRRPVVDFFCAGSDGGASCGLLCAPATSRYQLTCLVMMRVFLVLVACTTEVTESERRCDRHTTRHFRLHEATRPTRLRPVGLETRCRASRNFLLSGPSHEPSLAFALP